MTIGDRVRQRREELGLSLPELARRVGGGVKWQSIQQFEKNKVRRPHYLFDLARALDVSVEWLRGETDAVEPATSEIPTLPDATHGALAEESPEFVYVPVDAHRAPLPVIDYVQAGHWAPVVNPFERGDGYDWIIPDRCVSRDSFALIIRGRSMEPEFHDGDKVIIDPAVEPQPGEFVVAKLDQEEAATFKKYRPRGHDSNGIEIIDLVPLNPDWPSLTIGADKPGRIIGTMVEHRRYGRR